MCRVQPFSTPPIHVFSSLAHRLHRPHYPERTGLTTLVKHFQLLRMLSDWMKLYNGEQRCGITAESALFVCNKWDQINSKEREEVKKEQIDKLTRRHGNLNPKSQIVYLSCKTAQLAQTYGVITGEFDDLIAGISNLVVSSMKSNLEKFCR